MIRSTSTRILFAALLCAAASGMAVAQTADSTQQNQKRNEDQDLDRIPDDSQQSTASDSKSAAASAANQRLYIEDAFIPSGERSGLLVPSPPTGAPTWQQRLFLDIRKQWSLTDNLNFTFSDRLNFRGENDLSFPNHENVINEFREGYLSWQPVERWYFDLGRINIKSGAALGFNPTDFFKTSAVEEPLSADPSVLREDRLGTLMLEAPYLGKGRTLTFVYAPALVSPAAIPSNTALPSFNPSLDRTNSHTRMLLKGSIDLGADFSPEVLFYREGNQNKLGLNLTRSLGQKIVAYAEWAGGERSDLIDQALEYGRQTGTLPSSSPAILPNDHYARFSHDLSTGASYTTSNKITFNVEYHFHQAGFSGQAWNNWFNAGQGQRSSSFIARELWYIRSYALDQQEQLARNSTFLRADWVDAFVPDLEITGFVNTDLHDGSSLVQIGADYYISNTWTVGALVNTNIGSRRSDFGSLSQSFGILFKIARYF
jgi:hypothetical protein